MAQTKASDDYLLDALIKYALHLMTAGRSGVEIVACLEENLAWIEAQR